MLANPVSVCGSTLASSSLDLTHFSITTSSGTIVWLQPWTLSAFVAANNSAGDLDFDFETDAASASASASVNFASGDASASYSAADGMQAHVGASVSLPGGFAASAGVFPSVATLQNSFSIIGASGPVTVTINASLASSLVSVGGGVGQVLQNDTLGNISVDGAPSLVFSDQLLAGPGDSSSSLLSPDLSTTINLDPDTTYSFVASFETDPEVYTLPEQSGTGWLLLIACGAIAAARRSLRPSPSVD